MQRRAGGSRASKAGKTKLPPPDEQRDPKRFRSSILRYLKEPNAAQAGDSSRESSEEPGGVPSQTPAFPHVPGLDRHAAAGSLPTFPTGKKVQTGLLQSLQRRFVEQALATPADPAAAAAQQQEQKQHLVPSSAARMDEDRPEDEELDGFVLYSQPTYERPLSQRFPDDGLDLGISGSAEDTLSHWDAAAALGGGAAAAEPSQHQSTAAGGGRPAPPDPDELRRRLSNASNTSHGTTPGIGSEERAAAVAAAGLGSAARLFPIFRSRSQMKQIYLIRHGESEYNAESGKATMQGGKWEDPWIFDAPLTHKGCAQARSLRAKLAQLNLPADTLWVTSPLCRAIQTLLLCCPVAHLLPSPGAENAAPNGGAGSDDSNGDSGGASSSQPVPPTICVRHEISERVFTTGDIGHPPAMLAQRFPQLAPEIHTLPERWWYHKPGAKVNCALQQRFELSEPSESVNARIGAFKQWLLARPEKVVVAVGHSSYWSTLWKQQTGSKPDKMKNCELLGPLLI